MKKQSKNNSKSILQPKNNFRVLTTRLLTMRLPTTLFIIAITAFLIFSTAGCQGGGAGGAKKGENKEQLPEDYHIGTEAIYMEFMQNSPPPKVYAEDPSSMQVLLKVQNKGAYDVPAGQLIVELQGHDPTIMPMSPDENRLTGIMYGKSDAYPQGAFQLAGWKATDIRFPGDTYSPLMQATACYLYQTRAAPLICIDPNPYSALAQDKVCTVHDVSLGGGQGGPVSVTKIEEAIMPKNNKIIFRIYLANQGAGTVLVPEGNILGLCKQKRLKVSDVDKVRVYAKLGQNTQLNCQPQPYVLLTNKIGVATCEGTLSWSADQTAYTSELDIILDYGYTTSITKPVKIVKTGFAKN